MRIFLVVYIIFFCGCLAQNNEYKSKRRAMVKEQIENRGIKDERVLKALKKVRREEFVPEEYREFSYRDGPLPIGYDQTISQPYIVALMTETLQLRKEDKVLEIGTGSGYQAAVLAEIVDSVFTIEIIEPLAERAEKVLKELDYENVHLKVGDGYNGWKERAPFDAIIVTAAPKEVPQPLIDQLKEGGRIVIPVGEKNEIQNLYFGIKRSGKIDFEKKLPVRFVPLIRSN